MDFKQFRDTAELSDFTVYIDNERFKLHKFPLYTKSDYFKEIASSNPVCQINDFPGGSKSFAVVADFCYGKEINITSENVVYLYAAADLLKMKGKDNLLEISRRFLDGVFRSALERKDIVNLICVLCSCCEIKSDAVKKICEDATTILMSLWLHGENSLKGCFSPHTMNFTHSEREIFSDESVSDYLAYLPLGMFLKIINIARDQNVEEKVVLDACAKYLGRVLDFYDSEVSRNEVSKNSDAQNNSDMKNVPSKEVSNSGENIIPGQPFCGLNVKIKSDHQIRLEKLYKDNISLLEDLKNTAEQFEKIFETLPKPNDIYDFINTTWIIKALLLTDSNKVKSKCRLDILKIAKRMLTNFSEQDFDKLSPSVMNDILNANNMQVEKLPSDEAINLSRRSSKRKSYKEEILENNATEILGSRKQSSIKEANIEDVSEKHENTNETKSEILPESVANKIIKYMLKKADEQKLTMQQYIQLLKQIQVPNNQTSLDNDLVKILIKLTKSGQPRNEEDAHEIITHISLNNCTADTLNDALELDLFPPKTVAAAALYVANKKQNTFTLLMMIFKYWLLRSHTSSSIHVHVFILLIFGKGK
ncbi:calmodulin-related [Schistosoma mansoni]|uniref:calmodulin-related n=1 Tax=Schistosoma mansoni TaxID=6183 RepID=UPI00022C85BF|nr:calmodulin-related [Schistosoma mansoni]|eukprot:XP_018645429.1 calmodulin-related [Schistosoma mansoni]